VNDEVAEYRTKDTRAVRALFCIGVSQGFFDASGGERAVAVAAFKDAFADLRGRFGVEVLGTLDDDELMVGPSAGWPWTAYILAEAPSLDAVISVCNLVREWQVSGDDRLWHYARIEARVGRRLFFGNE
jgi:hypothetical protein